MAKVMFGFGSYGLKRTLHPDDTSGILWIYGSGTPAQPVIGYSPTSFSFTAIQGGANPSGQTLNIQNTGGGRLNWAVNGNAAWLTLSPSSGTSNGQVNPVAVGVNIAGLSAGSYSANITIAAAGASNTPRTLPVSLTINASTPSLGSGVDNTALSWTTGGNASWFAETVTSYYGGSADQSGVISHSQSTWLRSTVSGPGTLSFWWKVASEANYDFLKFSIDGVVQSQISGAVGWQQKSYSIGSGTHTLEWTYAKDVSVNISSDCSWLDKVEYTAAAPPSPVIGNNPASFTFTATKDGANPVGQTLNIQNTGGGTLTGQLMGVLPG